MKNHVFIFFIAAFVVMSCKNAAEKKAEPTTAAPSVTAVDTTEMPEPAIAGGSTFTCYQFVSKGKDVSSCQIETRATLNPFVSGYYDWAPYEKDGAHGVLKNGVIANGLLTADYVYMIEGSVQSEEVYFKIEGDKLTKMEGELVEKKGKMIAKDKTKLKAVDVMTKVDCAKLKETVDNIKSFEKQLK